MKNYSSDFTERRDRAAEARKALLERFSAKPDPNDPAVQARAAERRATQAAREARAAERLAARQAETEAAAARLAAAQAAGEADAAERSAREVALAAEQKAQRDARYAARKARQA